MWAKSFLLVFGLIALSITLLAPLDAHAQTSGSTLTIAGQPATAAVVNTEYRFGPATSGGRGSFRWFWVRGKPTWASFSALTGTLTGRPTASQVGDYADIRISVTDGRSTAYLPAFSIKVAAGMATTNRPPTISGTPATTVPAGSSYAFQPSASDPDGDALGFTIQGKPAWASFSPSTGRLSGTPTQVGNFSGITIMASDGKAVSSLSPFSIAVLSSGTTTTNTAPTISGSPATAVVAGQPYSFQPTASDPDGDPIGFGISNKPTWAAFSASTGRLAGTPTAGDVGTTSNIVIAVSDAKANTALAPFGIVVTQGANGSATVTWSAPTMNTDGTPITNLAGYRIQYGTNASSLTQTINVSNPGLMTYVVENLSAGTWYFSVIAYNSSGVASSPTGTAAKSVL